MSLLKTLLSQLQVTLLHRVIGWRLRMKLVTRWQWFPETVSVRSWCRQWGLCFLQRLFLLTLKRSLLGKCCKYSCSRSQIYSCQMLASDVFPISRCRSLYTPLSSFVISISGVAHVCCTVTVLIDFFYEGFYCSQKFQNEIFRHCWRGIFVYTEWQMIFLITAEFVFEEPSHCSLCSACQSLVINFW